MPVWNELPRADPVSNVTNVVMHDAFRSMTWLTLVPLSSSQLKK